MDPAALILFTLLSLAVDLATTAILSAVYRRLIAAGKSPVLPFSLDSRLRVAALTEWRGFLALYASTALFWPILEETVFRVVPYMVAGLPGALAGTAAWALSHYTKLYVENSHLERGDFLLLASAYLGCVAAGGLTYALGMHASGALWLPYPLHVIHNTWVLASMRAAAVRAPRAGFVKPAAQQRQVKQQAQAKAATRSVAGIRWEYLE